MLASDLSAREVEVVDVHAATFERSRVEAEASAIVVVHGRHIPRVPTPSEVSAVRGRGGPVVVVRRDGAKLAVDDHPGRTTALALWGDYYQPGASETSGRAAGGGYANLLDILGGARTLRLSGDYVFVSYHAETDRGFVQDEVRPCLARAGLASWDFRMSERLENERVPLADDDLRHELELRVVPAGALLVVATPGWASRWTELEVALARTHGIPVVGVRPRGSAPCTSSVLTGVRVHTLAEGRIDAPTLTTSLQRALGRR